MSDVEVTPEMVQKAFEGLDAGLKDEDVDKSSTGDLTQPEGGDLGWGKNANPKMSAEANKDGASNNEDDASERNPKSSDKKSPKGDNSVKSEGEQGMGNNVFMKAACKSCGKEGDPDIMKDHSCSTDKSMTSFDERLDDEVKGKMEVSGFLKSMIETTGKHLDDLTEAINKSSEAQTDVMKSLQEQVSDLQQYQAKIGIVLKAICKEMNIISNEPASEPKADTEINKGDKPVERNFENNNDEADIKKAFPGLSDNPNVAKSQITGIMADMVYKGELDDTAVIAFESGGFIEPNLVPKIQKALAGQVAA